MKKTNSNLSNFALFLNNKCSHIIKCLGHKVRPENIKYIIEDLQTSEKEFYRWELKTYKAFSVKLQDSPTFRKRSLNMQRILKNTFQLFIAMVRHKIHSKLDLNLKYTKEGLMVNEIAFRKLNDEVVKHDSQTAIAAVVSKLEAAKCIGLNSTSKVYQKIIREKKKVDKVIEHFTQMLFSTSFFQVVQPSN